MRLLKSQTFMNGTIFKKAFGALFTILVLTLQPRSPRKRQKSMMFKSKKGKLTSLETVNDKYFYVLRQQADFEERLYGNFFKKKTPKQIHQIGNQNAGA